MTQKYEVFQMKWLRYKDLLDPSQWQRFTVCNSNYNRPHIIYPVNYSISSEPFLSYKIFFVFVSFLYQKTNEIVYTCYMDVCWLVADLDRHSIG